MGCGECGFFGTGCSPQDNSAPCVIARRKKEAIEEQEAEEKRIAELNTEKCKNCDFYKQEWADIGFCYIEKKPEATKDEFECWCGKFKQAFKKG